MRRLSMSWSRHDDARVYSRLGVGFGVWSGYRDHARGGIVSDRPLSASSLNDLLICERLPYFWERVDRRSDGCWGWTGAKTQKGYGYLKVDGKFFRAHRFSYLALVGPIPEGTELDHLCRVKECVNPEHLEAVSHRENVLRGVSPIARNVQKTHCPQGHPYSGTNLYTNPGGGRFCRECTNQARIRYWTKKGLRGYGA